LDEGEAGHHQWQVLIAQLELGGQEGQSQGDSKEGKGRKVDGGGSSVLGGNNRLG